MMAHTEYTKKHFTIDINGRHEVVSLDRLKPAYLDTDLVLPHTTCLSTPAPNPVTTRSGRTVHWPSKIIEQPFIVH